MTTASISVPTPEVRALLGSEEREDMHVHSTFSDGKSSVRQNLERAMARGLARITCVDHVRKDTAWVPTFVETVRAEASRLGSSGPRVFIGLEAKMLDECGTLDLPEGPSKLLGADFVYVADHQFPIGGTCVSPSNVRRGLADGSLTEARVLEALFNATFRALERHDHVVIAHLFSILPKVGLHEGLLDDSAVRNLAACAKERGALIEVSEKWKCPSAGVLRTFLDAGVPVVSSTDSHAHENIGVYDNYAREALSQARGRNAA
jgi:putative hydrolase